MKLTIILVSSLLALGACGDDDGGAEDSTLNLTFASLPELGSTHVYEGWLITTTGPKSSGRFSVDSAGTLSQSSFAIEHAVADDATAFLLTIEPATGDDPAPSDTHLIGGPLASNSAALTISDAAALGTDFSAAAGSYILATPTTNLIGDDETQGIWWLTPGAAPSASLTLPTLPAGWVYEGWVVGANGPVSTGTFTAADVVDSDGAGSDAGSDPAPPFPGADFIDPAMDLLGGAAVISVEPSPDDSPMPFAIKPLVDDNVEDIAAPTSQAMTNMATANIPSGTATLMGHSHE